VVGGDPLRHVVKSAVLSVWVRNPVLLLAVAVLAAAAVGPVTARSL
jgi:hypothetical protein